MTKRRRRLTAEQITAAAVRIADAEGLEAVSIRRLATELGVPPMTLYGRIAGKDELISLMADQVTGEVLIEGPQPEDWREALLALARRNYAVLVGHPWLPAATSVQYRQFGPNATAAARQYAESLKGQPLDSDDLWLIIGSITDYVLGHTLRAVTAPKPEDIDQPIPKSDIVEAPELASLPEALRARSRVERFEAGLRLLLEGIERAYFR
jgi:AcrR family transcriptional regulator